MNQMKYLVPVFIILVILCVNPLRFAPADRVLIQNRTSLQTRRSEYRNAFLTDGDIQRNKRMVRSEIRSTIRDSLQQERVGNSEFGVNFLSRGHRHEIFSSPEMERNTRSDLLRRIEGDIDTFFKSPRNHALNDERSRTNIRRRYTNLNDHLVYNNFEFRFIKNRQVQSDVGRSRFFENADLNERWYVRKFARDFRQGRFVDRRLDSEFKLTLSNSRTYEKIAPIFESTYNYFQFCYEIISSKFDKIDKYTVMITVGILLYDVYFIAQAKRKGSKNKCIVQSLMVPWSNGIH